MLRAKHLNHVNKALKDGFDSGVVVGVIGTISHTSAINEAARAHVLLDIGLSRIGVIAGTQRWDFGGSRSGWVMTA
jgi:hypothetical protein